jgi:chromosome segregation ATPase
MEFEQGRSDTALVGFGLQSAGTPAGQKAHKALKQSNEDNRALRHALAEVVGNGKDKHAAHEAEIRRLQEALNVSNSQLQSLRNALNALSEQYSK